jgi:nucleoside-diphosphate-sugar epimerase
VDFVALRYSSNYGWGRGQRKLLSRASWAVDLFENPVQGLPVRVPFAAVKNSFVYVKDSVLATLLALRAAQLNRRVFDVVSEPYSKADAAEVVKKLVPDAKIEMDMTGAFGSDSPPERPTLISWQNKTIEKELGYKPRYSLEAGITDYIAMLKTGTFKW